MKCESVVAVILAFSLAHTGLGARVSLDALADEESNDVLDADALADEESSDVLDEDALADEESSEVLDVEENGPWQPGMPSSSWHAPQPFCARFGRSVKDTAKCIFQDGMTHGGWHGEFPFIAGPDMLLSKNEWAARVGNTHASMVIFMAMATQEDHHADDPNSIDWTDWDHFLESAQAAGGRMNPSAFGDYVAARVTAELIFEVADGKKNLGGSWSNFFPDLSHKLTAVEWMSAFHYVNDWSRGGNSKVTPDEFLRAVGLSDVDDIFNVFQFIEGLGEGKCPHFHDWSWHQSHSNPNDGHEIDQCEWNQLPGYLESQLRMFDYSDSYHWDNSHGISAGFFAEVVARMVTVFFKSHSGSGPYPHGGSWQAPQPFCAHFGSSVKQTGECIFNDGMTHGGWNGEFQYIAGPDGRLSKDEWAARVGNTHASMVIFMAMATQEDHHADDPNSIDIEDWRHWMRDTRTAMLGKGRRSRGKRMNAEKFGNYAAARATAELIFEVADGKKNLGGSWANFFPDLRHELTAREWMNAYHYVNDWSYGGNSKVTPDEFKRAVGLSDVNDVFAVFEFFEGLGEGKCPGAHDWYWMMSHSDPNDGHEIDQCEWNQLPGYLESKLREFQYGRNKRWNANQGISAGFFSEVVARMVGKYFREHNKW